MTNPFSRFVGGYEKLLAEGRDCPLGGFASTRSAPQISPDAPKVLLFSPHPDDECITGALPLRLLRELKMNVINVAVTQGSRTDRQAGRLAELKNACNYIGFGLLQTKENGLEKINLKTRTSEPASWAKSVEVIAAMLLQHRPHCLFFPHSADANSSHIGTHFLVLDALAKLGGAFSCLVVETEFWSALPNPNLMIESSLEDVADLVAATSFHVEEVRRNPYHLTLPSWMQDNVRRGGELVGGQGAAAPDYLFATLYRLSRWCDGKLSSGLQSGMSIGRKDSLSSLFV